MKNIIKILLSVFVVLVGLWLLVGSVFLGEILPMDAKIVLIGMSVIIFIIGIIIGLLIDYSLGGYRCKDCGTIFVPSLTEYIFSIHTITKRKLKCPKCNKSSFCDRILNNEINENK